MSAFHPKLIPSPERTLGAIPVPVMRVIAKADNVAKRFRARDQEVTALRNIDLSIAAGSFVAILGRSGCGKSTLLRVLAGLLEPSAGTVSIDGNPIAGPPESVRYVFQDYGGSLFPWRNVIGNVRFGANNSPQPPASRAEVRKVALEALDLVGLAHVADRYPWELSGGMQQRVAIARAIASKPSLLLMDEPFGAVDALSRSSLQDAILKLWRGLNLTVLLVTHDIEEAIYLAERVIVIDPVGNGIQADIAVDLPWPRSQIETRELPEYHRLRRKLTSAAVGAV